jgi:HlyD family secretion protein
MSGPANRLSPFGCVNLIPVRANIDQGTRVDDSSGEAAMKGKTFWVLLVAFLAGGGVIGWQAYQTWMAALPPGFASGNGRVESVQVDVTTKEPGRVQSILVHEGDIVHPGQIVAKMDTITMEAELARAEATVAEQEAKTFEVEAAIAKADSQLKLDEIEFGRTRALLARKAVPREEYDVKQTTVKTSTATLNGEKARLETARKSVAAAKAEVAHTQSRINDMTLHSTVSGRVLYRLAEEGEVLGSGGKVLTLVNFGDVYMEIYLPAQDAMRVKIGADARIVFDIAPEYAARAKVSFVAPEAQFTPKQVETKTERDKLMFRVKLTVPAERVLQYIERVKTGIRGMGYVRLDDSVQWPERLDRRPPESSASSAGSSASQPDSSAPPAGVPQKADAKAPATGENANKKEPVTEEKADTKAQATEEKTDTKAPATEEKANTKAPTTEEKANTKAPATEKKAATPPGGAGSSPNPE